MTRAPGSMTMADDTPPPPPDKPDEGTGLPGLTRWKAVYGVVGVIFALWVALLSVLTHAFR